MASTNQTTVLEDLSFLLGESSVPTSGIEDRQRFIQCALDRVYRAYDFPMTKSTATISMIGGIATLPTTVHQDSILDIRIINPGIGDDIIWNQIEYEDQDSWVQGQYKYWLDGYEGTYVINSNETGITDTLTIRFQGVSPIINASIPTPFPSSMALARGALVYLRQAEDPQADIAQEEYLFQEELDEVIAQYNRSRPQKRGKTLHEAMGTYIGDITDAGASFDV